MSQLIVQGGKSLEGEITIGGAKNAALKMIAAALLTTERVTLTNVPDILDIRHMIKIVEHLGVQAEFSNHCLTLQAPRVLLGDPDYQLVKHLRGSVVIIGPLLARLGHAKIPQPGGCLIGARPIDTHINAFRQLGVTVDQEKDYYHFKSEKLDGAKIVLDEMSVTATENILMASVCASGTSEIHMAASEPEVVDLACLLKKMGAKISGEGTSVLTIKGVSSLHGAEHRVIPDRIEAGTFAIAAAVSRGDVRIKGVEPSHLDAILQKLKASNVSFIVEGTSTLHIKPTTMFTPISVDTRPFPGYPTDLQAPLSVLLTQASGTSKIFETMYEGRLGYVDELKKMGADITPVDPHTIIINGPTPLYGKRITSIDIRAGATLIIAALVAEGESIIKKVEIVDRGYEHIETQLKKLGAIIARK
ncbi:MAG: UDP-N-acetylglucosamine 1-carboxyvinyltransferase [Patescibacteria group bacterium]